jgi:hypothetical protein
MAYIKLYFGLFSPNHNVPKSLTIAGAKGVLGIILSLAVCMTGRAQFSTIAYDGFNYSTGSLAGDNGGTGWATAWTNDYSSGASFNVIATGMTYSGLTTSGGSIAWGSGGNGISEDSRTLSLMDSGVVYIQFLSQFGSSSSGGGTPNIRLYDSGALTGGFGSNGGSTMSILNSLLQPASGGSSSSSASLTALNLVVGRIDYENDITMMWVNPDLSTFDYQNPAAPDATYTNLAPAFNTIAIYSRSPANLDEFTVMAEPAPEPSSSVLLGMSLILWMRPLCRHVMSS